MHVGHRVCKSLSEERFHLLKNSRVNRRGGCIVQVDYSLHSIPPELPCCSFPHPDKGQRYPESERSILLNIAEFPSASPSTDSITDVIPDIHRSVVSICCRIPRTGMESAVHCCSPSPKPSRATPLSVTDLDLLYDRCRVLCPGDLLIPFQQR